MVQLVQRSGLWYENMPNSNLEIKTPTEDKDNWRKIGLVMQWIRGKQLSGSDLIIYLEITRKTVGYGQYTSECIPISDFVKDTSLGRYTVIKSLRSLIDATLIIRPASNHTGDSFKSAYQYQLNMKADSAFPSLGALRKNREQATTSGSHRSINLDQQMKSYIEDSSSFSNNQVSELYALADKLMEKDDSRRALDKKKFKRGKKYKEILEKDNSNLLYQLKKN